MENLADCIRMWMVDYKKNNLKATSYNRMVVSRKLLERYPIARMNVGDVQLDDIQRFINQMILDGYSRSTIRIECSFLSTFFRFALSRGLVSAAFYLEIRVPKEENVRKPRKEIAIFSREDQDALMSVFETMSDRTYAAGILMLEEGLRVGEVLALEWSDILWNRKALRVSKTFIYMGRQPFVQRNPKTKSSIRTVPLSRKSIAALKNLFDSRDPESDYLFPSDDEPNMPMSYWQLRQCILWIFEQEGIEFHGFHAFRHTFASNCYEKGCDIKVLSRLLGHQNVSVTYDIYIHLFGDELEEMRKIID